MKSRWSDSDARKAIDLWGPRHGEDFALRLYTARLIGSDPEFVLPGGGNVSVKGTHPTHRGPMSAAVYVKASGRDLAKLDPEGLPGLEMAGLGRLRSMDSLTEDEMASELRRHLLDDNAPTPSIETPMHALLPHRFVDHSHANAVLAIADRPDGRALVREVFGGRVAVVDYVRSGLELARAAVDCYEAEPNIEGMVLVEHGLITFAEDAQSVYERHIALVDACERFIERTPGIAS